jgi:uncharacterized membrane protein (DUF106 family)
VHPCLSVAPIGFLGDRLEADMIDWLNAGLNLLLRAYFAVLSWAPPVYSLTLISALLGVAMLWVFAKTSNQKGLRQTKRMIHAYLLELRVFADEPAMVWRSQKALFAANLRHLGLALKPALLMCVPVALLLIHLQAFYGRQPLPVGQQALVTVALGSRLAAQSVTPQLIAPAGIALDSAPVRVIDQNEVTWRIQPRANVSARLVFRIGNENFDKAIEAGGPQRFISERRTGSALASLWNADEKRIASPAIKWVEIGYPEARVDFLGWRIHWLVWLLLVSTVSALLMKKRMGVVL